ncbi:FAD-dependent oxidoreductase [Aquimarina hainanensis]|uniref:FAD-dependent oxidoreductase n=1 Tax=Aquimarina hainanensis TaxID=1578017 RepID=A0ABW5NE04_9FLAO
MLTPLPKTNTDSNSNPIPHVAIFGAGISGLKTAHECIKKGFRVSIYEAREQPGGKCIGFMNSGLPYELTHRQMFSSNPVLLNTLKEISTSEGDNLMTKIEPLPKAQFVWAQKNKTVHFSQKHFNVFTELIYNLKSAWSMLVDGVPIKDVYWFRTRLSAKVIQKSDMNSPVSSYLEYDKRPLLASFLRKVLSSWIAATDNTRTGDILQLLLNKKIPPSSLSPATYSVTLNGPINDTLIIPWYQYLKEQGVNFHFNTALKDIKLSNSKCQYAILDNGVTVQADFFIIAIPPYQTLNILPELKPLLKVESVKSHGFQLHLKKIPSTFKNKSIGIIIDSAWGLSYKLYHSGKYNNTVFAENIQATLSITATRMEHAKGILYHKTLLECNQQEIHDEILAQLGLFSPEFNDCFFNTIQAGPGALIVRKQEANNPKYKNWFKGPEIIDPYGNAAHWLVQNQLENPTCSNGVSTDSCLASNVFIAGEWLNHPQQKWTVPSTIERSMENAQLCVNDVMKEATLV